MIDMVSPVSPVISDQYRICRDYIVPFPLDAIQPSQLRPHQSCCLLTFDCPVANSDFTYRSISPPSTPSPASVPYKLLASLFAQPHTNHHTGPRECYISRKKLSHCDHGYPASSLSVRFSIVLSSSSKVSFGLQKNPWQHQPILKTLVPVLLCISILLKLCVSMYSVFVCFDAWQHSWSDFPLRSKALVSP